MRKRNFVFRMVKARTWARDHLKDTDGRLLVGTNISITICIAKYSFYDRTKQNAL